MTHKKFPVSRTQHAQEPQMARVPQVEDPWLKPMQMYKIISMLGLKLS